MSYLSVLRHWRFGVLWGGLTLSSVGDSVTRLALIWLAYHLRKSAFDVGLLVAAYSAPIVIGGPLAGIVLDRVGPRAAMLVDNLVRGSSVGLIPILFHLGFLRPWHLFAVAGGYGLLRMITLAGAPTMIPMMLLPEELNAANALETISFSLSDAVGLPLAGILLSVMSGADVLVIDAISYFLLVACLSVIGPLPTQKTLVSPASRLAQLDSGLTRTIQFSLNNRFIRNSTLAYMVLNVGRGILEVLIPVILLQEPGAGSRILGFVTAGAAIGGFAGSIRAGFAPKGASYPQLIARNLSLNGLPLLVFAFKWPWAVLALGLSISSFIQAPLTVWAQTERMRLIPDAIRGRVFALLRSVMQSGPALGGIVGSVAVAIMPRWGVTALVVVLMSGPGLLALLNSGLLDTGARPSGV